MRARRVSDVKSYGNPPETIAVYRYYERVVASAIRPCSQQQRGKIAFENRGNAAPNYRSLYRGRTKRRQRRIAYRYGSRRLSRDGLPHARANYTRIRSIRIGRTENATLRKGQAEIPKSSRLVRSLVNSISRREVTYNFYGHVLRAAPEGSSRTIARPRIIAGSSPGGGRYFYTWQPVRRGLKRGCRGSAPADGGTAV